jgi:hypothetical protein
VFLLELPESIAPPLGIPQYAGADLDRLRGASVRERPKGFMDSAMVNIVYVHGLLIYLSGGSEVKTHDVTTR